MDDTALFKITNGLYVLGCRDGGRFVGSLIDVVTQVSHCPSYIAISCGNNSYTKKCIEKEGGFSISILGKSISPFIIGNFGFQSSKDTNKWDNVEYFIENNLPFLSNNIATITAKVLQKIPFDNNTMFIADVIDAKNFKDEDAVTYGEYRVSLKNLVTVAMDDFKKNKDLGLKENEMLEKNKKNKDKLDKQEKQEYVCSVCNYIYNGKIPFEELTDNYVCPVCGVSKNFFS